MKNNQIEWVHKEEQTMLRLYIVRHGKTLFNEKHMIQGWCDAPLTKEGLEQAKALGQGLTNIPFTACVSSPLFRAIKTGKEIIKDRNIPFELNDHLIEYNYGHLEGESESQLEKIYPIFLGQEIEDYDGESYQDFTKRILKGLEEIYDQYPDGNVLVITHAGVITCLLKEISTLPENKLLTDHNANVDNGSITILERNFGWKIIDVNNTSFLEK